MSVEDAEGGKVQEASRFLGQPPVKIDQGEMDELKRKRDELQAEVARLTQENRFRDEKIKELQRTVQIMQARSAK
jgi:chaperonin cofactor prefoldin